LTTGLADCKRRGVSFEISSHEAVKPKTRSGGTHTVERDDFTHIAGEGWVGGIGDSVADRFKRLLSNFGEVVKKVSVCCRWIWAVEEGRQRRLGALGPPGVCPARVQGYLAAYMTCISALSPRPRIGAPHSTLHLPLS
jgi:hypothetical protein